MFEVLRNEDTIQSEDDEIVVEREWQVLKKSLTSAATEVLPKMKRKFKKS